MDRELGKLLVEGGLSKRSALRLPLWLRSGNGCGVRWWSDDDQGAKRGIGGPESQETVGLGRSIRLRGG